MLGSESSMRGGEVSTVRVVYASGAIFSVVGAALIILSFIFLKRLRTMTTFLVFMLATSCLGSALSDCLSWFLYKMAPSGRLVEMSNDSSSVLCKVQAAGMQFFSVSSFFWTSCLALHAFNILCRKKNEESLKSFFKYYFLVSYLFPAITVSVCLALDSFGQTEDQVWCWIKPEHQFMRFAMYYIPLIVLWVFNVAIYTLLSQERYSSLSYGYLIKEGKRRLRLYILVFVVLKFPALINRLCNLFLDGRKLFMLFLIQAICDSLFGFFEALVYIVVVKKRLPNFCCKSQEETIGLADPLVQRETVVPYSSIAERMYYNKPRQATVSRSPAINN